MRKFALFIFPALLLAGCKADDPSVVAQVGHYKFHQNQISSPGEAAPLISAWVEDCLLALEAEARGIKMKPDFQEELSHIRLKLLADYLLEDEFSKIKPPGEEKLKEYYNTHKQEFQRTEMEVEFIYFSGLESAVLSSIRRALARGESPEKVAENYSGLLFKTEMISDPASMPEPYNVFAEHEVGSVIGPSEINGRTYVFRIMERFEPGTIYPFSRVRDVIAGRMKDSVMQTMRDKLLNELKGKYSPTINRERLKAAGIIIGENL